MAPRVNRGEIWLYSFGPPDKRRPVLVLSRQKAISLLRKASPSIDLQEPMASEGRYAPMSDPTLVWEAMVGRQVQL